MPSPTGHREGLPAPELDVRIESNVERPLNGGHGWEADIGCCSHRTMRQTFLGPRGTGITLALLALQFATLVVASGPWLQISIFCTGSASNALGSFFGILHLLFLAAFTLGLLALLVTRLRFPYALFLLLALPALPVQAWLVAEDKLTCDVP